MFTLDINIERSRNRRNLEEKCFQEEKKKARMLKEQRLISRVRWKKPDAFKARY